MLEKLLPYISDLDNPAGLSRSEMYGSNFSSTNAQHYVWLGNSDWRVEDTYAAESGPDMGETGSALFEHFQSNEPNDVGNDPGEDYVDMEINRASRTDGRWNDLPLRPNPSGALDAISGYIVEYGGWDYTDVDYDHGRNLHLYNPNHHIQQYNQK